MVKMNVIESLTSLVGFYGKLPACDQRKLFGQVLFGKKTIRVNRDNVCVFQKTMTGDVNTYTFSFDRISEWNAGDINLYVRD